MPRGGRAPGGSATTARRGPCAWLARRAGLVDQAIARHAVDDRRGLLEGLLGGVLILASYRLLLFFDPRAQQRALGDVARAVCLGLTRAFLGLCRIRQRKLLEHLGFGARNYADFAGLCQSRPG